MNAHRAVCVAGSVMESCVIIEQRNAAPTIRVRRSIGQRALVYEVSSALSRQPLHACCLQGYVPPVTRQQKRRKELEGTYDWCNESIYAPNVDCVSRWAELCARATIAGAFDRHAYDDG